MELKVTTSEIPQRIADAPGLVVARTIAMLINDALDGYYRGERYRVSPALRQCVWQEDV